MATAIKTTSPKLHNATAIMSIVRRALPTMSITYTTRITGAIEVMDVKAEWKGKSVTKTISGATLDHIERLIAQLHVGIATAR